MTSQDSFFFPQERAMNRQGNANKRYCVHIQGYEAVILYPALVTPALTPRGECLSVILAVKEDFYQEHLKDPERKDAKIGCLTARKMHSQLVLTEWGNAAIFNTDEVQYTGQKRRLVSQCNMIFAGHTDAVEKYKAGKYRGWYLGQLEEKDFPVKGFLRTDGRERERPWGVLHEGAVKMYRNAGYTHLFQLDFEEFTKAELPGMYELAFVYFKLYDDDDHAVAAAYDALHAKDGDARGPSEDETGKKLFCCYTDPDDDLVNDYFAAARLEERPRDLRKPKTIGARKLVGSNRMFPLYEATLNGGRPEAAAADQPPPLLKVSENTFLQSRHPVYIPDKWEGKVGAMGDLHVSSRQLLYKRSKAQVIPGADEADSPMLGNMAHVHGVSAFTLMDDIAGKSDVLAIVGDLYDHVINCDPTSEAFRNVRNAAGVWDAMSYSKYEGNWDAYPRGIDGLLLLAKILDVYTRKKRPVLYVSGNHEAYERPYGISPRLRVEDPKTMLARTVGISGDDNPTFYEFTRANAGIPADHNLTIYEAVLLHGPESYDLGTKHSKLNFTPENMEWIYCLFTPWKDCVVSCGMAYGLVCLGWGSSEDFLKSTVSGGGSLPRATESCTTEQVQLAQWAANTFQKSVLLTHFTLVCYDQLNALNDDKARVHTDQITYHGKYIPIERYARTKYDIGSFKHNREKIFELVTSHSINYSICGHSHRAGAYWHLGVGQTETRGIISDAADPFSGRISRLGQYNILVCGAAGPYSYQNVSGELGGYGMDFPQGLLLDMPGDSLTWVKDRRVKPRLAVLLEYLQYEGGYFWFGAGLFQRLVPTQRPVSTQPPVPTKKGVAYYFRLHPELLKIFKNKHPFKGMTLFAIGAESTAKLTLNIDNDAAGDDWASPYMIKLRPQDWGNFFPKVKNINPFAHFLSVKLRPVPDVIDTDLYDCASPWCFPVCVGTDYQHIYRPMKKTGGEVPNFGDYIKYWSKEYENK